jgi:hypothetical protein
MAILDLRSLVPLDYEAIDELAICLTLKEREVEL